MIVCRLLEIRVNDGRVLPLPPAQLLSMLFAGENDETRIYQSNFNIGIVNSRKAIPIMEHILKFHSPWQTEMASVKSPHGSAQSEGEPSKSYLLTAPC